MVTKFSKSSLIRSLLAAAMCAVALTGCDPNNHDSVTGKLEPPHQPPDHYVSNATYIATLPDGRQVYQFNVQHNSGQIADRVYFVTSAEGCSGAITVNRPERRGKQNVTTTRVTIVSEQKN